MQPMSVAEPHMNAECHVSFWMLYYERMYLLELSILTRHISLVGKLQCNLKNYLDN